MDENVHELIEQRFEKMVKEVHGNCTDAFYAIKEFNAYVQAFHDLGLITDEELSIVTYIHGNSTRRYISRKYPNGDYITFRPGEKTAFPR